MMWTVLSQETIDKYSLLPLRLPHCDVARAITAKGVPWFCVSSQPMSLAPKKKKKCVAHGGSETWGFVNMGQLTQTVIILTILGPDSDYLSYS